jgi:hypothetical protein
MAAFEPKAVIASSSVSVAPHRRASVPRRRGPMPFTARRRRAMASAVSTAAAGPAAGCASTPAAGRGGDGAPRGGGDGGGREGGGGRGAAVREDDGLFKIWIRIGPSYPWMIGRANELPRAEVAKISSFVAL